MAPSEIMPVRLGAIVGPPKDSTYPNDSPESEHPPVRTKTTIAGLPPNAPSVYKRSEWLEREKVREPLFNRDIIRRRDANA
jgi:hypothetical protein